MADLTGPTDPTDLPDMPMEDALHGYALAPAAAPQDGGPAWKPYCVKCSLAAGDYVWPCHVNGDRDAPGAGITLVDAERLTALAERIDRLRTALGAFGGALTSATRSLATVAEAIERFDPDRETGRG